MQNLITAKNCLFEFYGDIGIHIFAFGIFKNIIILKASSKMSAKRTSVEHITKQVSENIIHILSIAAVMVFPISTTISKWIGLFTRVASHAAVKSCHTKLVIQLPFFTVT